MKSGISLALIYIISYDTDKYHIYTRDYPCMQIKRGLLVGSSNYSVQIQFAPEKITVRYAVKMKKMCTSGMIALVANFQRFFRQFFLLPSQIVAANSLTPKNCTFIEF